MQNKHIILLFFIWVHTCNLFSQDPSELGNDDRIVHAYKDNGNFTTLLQKSIKYPVEGFKQRIEGDVILSLVITTDGKMDSISLVSSPSNILSTTSIDALDLLNEDWRPYTVNGIPIQKKYMVVFRYRIYMDSKPPQHAEKANGFLGDRKYAKALKFYDKAIKDNRYDHALYIARSNAKIRLNDREGALEDINQAKALNHEILTFVDINLLGFTRVRQSVKKEVYKDGP